MNLLTRTSSALLAGLALSSLGQAATVQLPASAALPPGSGTDSGFAIRVAQAPVDAEVGNNYLRALRQIEGTLTDIEGNPIADEAFEGTGPGGSHLEDLIYFERDGFPIDITDADGAVVDSLPSYFFPGIPGVTAHTDKFAVEVVAYVELPAGETTFGISVSADRTDVNDDDGYVVFVGANPRDFFATKVAEYQRIAQGFTVDQHIENQFTVSAPSAGIYPFRLLYWQTGRGANLHWYTIPSGSGLRTFVNSPEASALKAYRATSQAAPNAPYVADVQPLPDSSGIEPTAPIEILLADRTATVNTGSVKLFLNNAPATPLDVTKSGAHTTVVFQPDPARTTADNRVRLEFADSAGGAHVQEWQFEINTSGGNANPVAGQWDFDNGNLAATVGNPLAYLGGPGGIAAQKTEFGTTTDFGIDGIDGEPARVMRVPGDLDRNIGYVMDHGLTPNGGGTRVNQYTLIMDVFVAETGSFAAALLQTSSVDNTDDGDLFWQQGNFGQGGGGYNGKGTFTAGSWHRFAAAYDMAANPPVVVKYCDGIKQDDWTANQSLDNPRRSLLPTAVLFGDGDQDERREMFVNSIQIREGRVSDAQLALLGGPSADGIPQTLPTSSATGQWDFNFADLSATIGSPLQYLDGAGGQTETGTGFGVTGEGDFAAIPNIDGEAASIMRVPGDLSRNIGYIMEHRIAPNGGGTRVNQYTLIMDVFVAETGSGAAALWQTSSVDNTDDGDLFWQGSNFGQGGGGYNGKGTFTAGSWHRFAAAYDMAANPPVVVKYCDGIKQDDWTANQSLDNPRRSLLPTAVLFGDGDQDERREMFVSSIQIREGRLSDAQLALLGGPVAGGIPIALPTSNVTGQWDFNFADLSATIGSPLQYLDGAEGLTAAGTMFGITGEGDFAGIANINGEPASIMRVPGDLDRNIGYVIEHRIAPNGGGTRVNQYTLIMDVMVANEGAFAAAMLQTSSQDNTDDGDLFWQQGNFGQGANGYNGTGIFTAGEWHRVVAAYNMAANPPVVVKYVDGVFQDNWTANQSLDNPRRSLLPTAVLFGDGDQDERREWWVNAIQIRSAPLSPVEIESLGGPSAGGIPIALTVAAPPMLSVSRDGGSLTISWPADAAGYVLEATDTLPNGAWSEVPGVSGNSTTVTITGAQQYFRLQRP